LEKGATRTKCPIDGDTLVITDRSGVEIDYCPTCRGVWLDRGELDKILDRAAPPAAAPQMSAGHHEYDDDRSGKYRKKKKREGFLGELFDF
tara:strand:- start:294 stop:566 length:273 start_codon:yes stop_codon:yes gene_type:complete